MLSPTCLWVKYERLNNTQGDVNRESRGNNACKALSSATPVRWADVCVAAVAVQVCGSKTIIVTGKVLVPTGVFCLTKPIRHIVRNKRWHFEFFTWHTSDICASFYELVAHLNPWRRWNPRNIDTWSRGAYGCRLGATSSSRIHLLGITLLRFCSKRFT
jgi:hypothetical protein